MLAAAAACHRGAPPSFAPLPERLEPSTGRRSLAHTVIIAGHHFYPRGVQTLGSGATTVDASYSATLGGADLAVTRIDDEHLRAEVPAGIAGDALDLVVTGPFGLQGGLAKAWTASDVSLARLSGSAAAPARLSTGQQFTLTLSVQNLGGAAAQGVLPTVRSYNAFDILAAPAAQQIDGGATANFVWQCAARTPGAFAAHLAAAGADAISQETVTLEPVTAQGVIESRSALTAVAQPLASATVEVGQSLAFALSVTNTGSARALAVEFPPPQVSGSGALALVSGPPAQDLAGGETRSLTWIFRATAAGGAILAADGGLGQDGNDGAPVAIGRAEWPQVSLLAPARLVATAAPMPAKLSAGQSFTARLRVFNAGGEPARSVAPALQQGGAGPVLLDDVPAAVDLAPGASADFVLSLRAGSNPGSVTLSLLAKGVDGPSGVAVSAAAPGSPLVIETAPSLSGVASVPPQVSTGQAFPVRLDVTNAGAAAALSVQPIGSAPGARFTSTPAAQDVPGRATRSFFWTAVIDAPATVTFSANGTGVDQNSGASVALAAASAAPTAATSPASLQASATLDRLQASVGQAVIFSVTVHNAGQGTATSVSCATPSLTGTGAASLAATPAAQDIPAQASRIFQFNYTATAAGTVGFATSATGTDALSGMPLSAAPASANGLTVQAAASLSATAQILPATLSTGQVATLRIDVTNGGGATASAVTFGAVTMGSGAAATQLTTPPGQDVPGGATRSFSWTFRCTSAGALQLASTASGKDANTGVAVSTGPAAATATVQTAAALSAVAQVSTATARASVGQPLQLFLDVTNSGQAAARGFTPGAVTGAGVQVGTAPAPADVPGQTTVRFSWPLTAQAAGSTTLSVSGSATDANSGASVAPAAAGSAGLLIQSPASLASVARVSLAQVSVLQDLQLLLDVTNAGQADAISVQPLLPSTSGTAVATLGSPPAAQNIPGGSTRTFVFIVHPTASGTLGLAGSAAGSDVNSGAAVASPVATAPSVLVQRPASLTAVASLAPATASTNQTVSLTLAVTNTGEATAGAVSAGPVTITGSALATQLSAPAPRDVAGGATVNFVWTFGASSPGALQLSSSAGGSDLNSGLAVSTGTAGASSTIAAQASLSAVARLSSARVSIGQTLSLFLDVTNAGDATATAFAPGVVTATAAGAQVGPPPAALDVPGNSMVTFAWTLTAQSAGSMTFTTSGTARDANSGASVPLAPTTSPQLIIQTAPSLSAAMRVSATQVDVLQDFQLFLDVTNAGQATAVAVDPGPVTVSGATALVTAKPAVQNIPGGATRTFSFTIHPTSAGSLTLSTDATGKDANSGAPVSAAAVVSPAVAVQPPAALTASIAAPAVVNLGDTFTLSLTVVNSGGAGANGVTPGAPGIVPAGSATILAGPAPASAFLAGGASQIFTWTMRAAALGALGVSGSAAGNDANTAQALSASTSTPATITVQTAAALGATVSVPGSAVNVGQPFSVVVTALDTGGASAVSVVPQVTVSGTSTAVLSSGPTPASATIAGQANQAFTLQYTASTPGSLTFSAAPSGTDGTSGTTVTSATATSTAVTVQTPSALAATLAVGAAIALNDNFPVTLTVSNSGQALVTGLSPSNPSIATVSTGSATLLSGPVPAGPVTLAGGASQTFRWTFNASAVGTVGFASSASGVDANDSGARSASATASALVSEVMPVSANPFGDGTSFSYVFSWQGRVWLGPSKTGTGAVSMLPDGTAPQTELWQLELDNTDSTPVVNTAYTGAVLCHTIGGTGCLDNTTACGPDNEDGRGLFFEGSSGGVEWLGLAGARSASKGGSGPQRAYLSSSAFPLVSGGQHDFAYVDTSNLLFPTTRTMSAAHFFNGRLYLGYLDTSNQNGPVLNALVTMPALPGLEPASTDAVALGAMNLANFGISGLPFNSNFAPTMVDVITDFNGQLYMANDGAWYRSTVAIPGPCVFRGACADWQEVTPSALAYAARPSLPASATSDLRPSDRAVPSMVSFGGRLFAARNTNVFGPQLWSCAPATAGGPCNAGDWTLIAPDLDPNVSQFGNPNNKAVAFLAATATHLYVGFDNAVDGIVVYRTATAAASSRADFTGQLGCSAALATCQGLGTNGLGATLTDIADAKALSFNGQDYLYLSASVGAGPARVYRIAQ